MVRVRLLTSHWDSIDRRDSAVIVTEFTVDGHELHIEADQRALLEIAVIDPGSGDRLTFASDPERWALALPTAFRSGDYWAEAERLPVAAAAAARRGR